jgi:hypothetical protein
LCPQYICGAAIFAGLFHGQVGPASNTFGIITAALTHEDLPTVEGACVAIKGGLWELRTLTRRISGFVMPGGQLCSNGDNTFSVAVTMVLTSGGIGTLGFQGFLDHNTPIPTWGGTISQ